MSTAEFGDPNLGTAPAPVAEGQISPLTLSAPAPPVPVAPLLETPVAAPAAPIPVSDMRDVPLGTLIFREGLLTEEQLEEALQDGMQRAKRLGEVLLERGLVSENDLGRLLAGQKGLQFVQLDSAAVDPAAVGLLPVERARLHSVLPIGFQDGLPVVAVADPTNDLVIENVRRALNCEPHLVVAGRDALHRQIDVAYGAANGAPAAAEPLPAPQPLPPQPVQPLETVELDSATAVQPQEVQAPVVPEIAVVPSPAPAAEPPVEPASAPATANGEGLWLGSPDMVTEQPLLQPEPVFQPEPTASPETGLQPDAAPVEPVFAAEPMPSVEPVQAVEPTQAPAPLSISLTPAEPMAPVAPDPAPLPAQTPPQREPVLEPEPVLQAPALQPEPVLTPETLPQLETEPFVGTEAPLTVEPPAEPQPQTAARPSSDLQADEVLTWSVALRLADGDRMEIGAFHSSTEARDHARAVVEQLSTESGWPFFGGRFIRPEGIVSVDLLEPAGRWLGSAARRAAWSSNQQS